MLILLAGALALAQPTPLSLDDAISICREAYLGDETRAEAMFEALPLDEQLKVAVLCTGYLYGLREPQRPEHDS